MKNTHFIINSLSPNANAVEKAILQYYNGKQEFLSIKFSQYKKHAKVLTKESIAEGAEVIVACGGDGTVNEIGQCLVNTSVILGVIPIGSGNGLARHLLIPRNIVSALEVLNKANTKKIDVGKLNNHYFFCNTSLAFSAQVISSYDQIKQRGINGYARAIFKSISTFKYKSFVIQMDNTKVETEPFILLISNTNQLGYNTTLTPKANITDGKLDMIIVEKTNLAFILSFIFLAFFKISPPFMKIKKAEIKKIKLLHSNESIGIQIDGERIEHEGGDLEIKVLPESLEIIC